VTRLLYLPAVLAVAAGVAEAGAGRPVIAKLEGQVSGVIRNDSTHAAIGANTFTLEVSGVAAGSPLSLRLVGPDGRVIDAPVKSLDKVPEQGHGSAPSSPGEADAVTAKEPTPAPPSASRAAVVATPPAPGATATENGATKGTGAETRGEDTHDAVDDAHPEGTPDDHADVAADDHASGEVDDHGSEAGDDHAASITDDHSEADPQDSEAVAVEEPATPAVEGTSDTAPAEEHNDSAAPADEHAESGGHGSEADDHGPAASFAGWTKVNLSEGNWKAELLSGDEVRSVASFAVTYGGPSPYYLTVTGGLIVGFLLLGVTNRVLLARQVSR
jgi:hypothetical protein